MKLIPHPDADGGPVTGIEAFIVRVPHGLRVLFWVKGEIGAIVVPGEVGPERTNELWRHTCFELFVKGEGASYAEYNFSTSGQWAAYGFDDYRAGMRKLEVAAPAISVKLDHGRLAPMATVGLPKWLRGSALQCNLTAVIEGVDGQRYYWALTHPDGSPDFHHPDCFTAVLPPVEGA